MAAISAITFRVLRTTIVASVWCAGLVVCVSCAQNRRVQPVSKEPDAPLVFVYAVPAPLDKLGLEVAVWSNCKVLSARSEEDVGQRYYQGQITRDCLQSIKDLIHTMGVHNSRCRGRVLWDTATEYLIVRTSECSVCWAHSPEDAEAADLRITALRKVLLSLPLSNVREVAPDALERAGWCLPDALERGFLGGKIPGA
jgi:hypothetical protein